jgi:hypothetical protein
MMTNGTTFFEKSEALRKAREQGAAGVTYHTQINEYQRALIHRMLNVALGDTAFVSELLRQPGDQVPMGKSAMDEALYLAEAFGGKLVQIENENPGILHGLCL